MSRDRSQVDLSENKRATEKERTEKGGKARGREVRDLDFLYYQFMPLHRLPIYSNLAEKRPVIVSASLSSACLPTSLVIHHRRRRRCSSVSAHPLSGSRLLLLHLLSSSVSFLFRGKGRTAFLCRWKMRPRCSGGRRRAPRVDERKRERSGE